MISLPPHPPTLNHPNTAKHLGILLAVTALLRLRLLYDAVEQLAAGAQLRDKVDEPVVLVDVVQLDDAGVVHAPEDLDLAPEALDAANLALLDRLDRVPLQFGIYSDWIGLDWFDLVRFGSVRFGSVRFGSVGSVRFGFGSGSRFDSSVVWVGFGTVKPPSPYSPARAKQLYPKTR